MVKVATVFFVYMLFWAVSAFVVLPFGVRNASDEDRPDLVEGQERGAPTRFNGRRLVVRTTIVATIAYVLFYANYIEGWVTIDDVSIIHPPASLSKGY